MTDTALATRQDPREAALLKAVGLDKAAPEQRELAIAIAERYGLDLMLKHLVLVEGRPYITRDGLLHVAHRSGVLDGIEVSPPELDGDYWRSTCSVYRKDMSRPFTFPGRYPARGGNAKFAPEMAIKVGEVMALRRAFDVSAPVAEERWDLDAAPAPEPVAKVSLADRARTAAAAVDAPGPEPEPVVVSEPAAGRCDAPSPYGDDSEPCADVAGHKPPHRNHARESWT